MADNITVQSSVVGISVIGGIGPQGEKGWSPVIAIETDSIKYVMKVTDWVGGAGTKPAINQYVGPTGFVSTFAAAVDLGVGSVVARLGVANTFTQPQAIAGGTVTTSAPLLNLTQTWNASAVAFNGLLLNVTDTASAVGSTLIDLQVGGTSKFKVFKDGAIQVSGTSTMAAINTSGNVSLTNTATTLGWTDVILQRDAANTLALRNGTSAQILNIYNTYSGAGANYERGGLDWVTQPNTLSLSTTKLGTGVARGIWVNSAASLDLMVAAGQNLNFDQGGSAIWRFNGSGHFIAATDNTYDIGASGASRPRVGYFATGINVAGSGYLTFNGSSILKSPADGSISISNNAATATTTLAVDASNTLSLRNGVSAQTFNVYNTYTDASNYEKGGLIWSANQLVVGTQNAGTGVARPLVFGTNNVARWTIDTSGNLQAVTDNTYDIGASGANRPRNIYVGGQVSATSNLQAGASAGVLWASRTILSAPADGVLSISNNASTSAALIAIEANNIVSLRNGVNAQGFNVYNTYTDASNYERGVFDFTTVANTLSIGSNAAGTGTLRNLNINGAAINLRTGNTSRWQVDTSGNLIAVTDSTYDIGASGANRPRSLYLAGPIFAGSYNGVGYIAAGAGSQIGWAGRTNMTSPIADTMQIGIADSATPTAQTLQVSSVVAGTTNTAGPVFTINGSRGTGTGAGGSIVFKVAPAGTTGSTQNALTTAVTIASDKSVTFTGAISGVVGIVNSGNITNNTTQFYQWGGATRIGCTVDGNITLLNNAQTNFGLLQLGGITASFPAWKRNGVSIDAKLADDSALTTVNIANPTATTHAATKAYVDTAVAGVVAGSSLIYNRIINGDMRIDQRHAGASVSMPTSGNSYIIDRWVASQSLSTGSSSLQQVSIAWTGCNATKALRFTVGAAQASLASGNFSEIVQLIEGFNVADLKWGTAAARGVFVDFWAQSSVAGNYCISIYGPLTPMSYVHVFALAANTPTRISFFVPGPTTGTWATGNTAGIQINISYACGSGLQTATLDAWQVGTFIGTTGTAVNILATAGATFDLTDVQLVASSTQVEFERRDFSSELLRCQRYYENCYPYGSVPAVNLGGNSRGVAQAWSVSSASASFKFMVEKRATPTITLFSGPDYASSSSRWAWLSGAWADSTATTASPTTKQVEIQVSSSAGYTTTSCYFVSGGWVADAEL